MAKRKADNDVFSKELGELMQSDNEQVKRLAKGIYKELSK